MTVKIHDTELPSAFDLFKLAQSTRRSSPNRAVAVFDQRHHMPGVQIPVRRVGDELRLGFANFRVEAGDAVMGRDPVLPGTGLDQVGDVSIRKTLLDPVVGEDVPVEPRKAFLRAEPQETVRVANDAVDTIARQTICRRIQLDGSPFCPDDPC